ncbi:MAG: N-acetyltransferase [Calditrichaeota bacterium]|nr:N-acetyltransferase [Calditrichota bacterium]
MSLAIIPVYTEKELRAFIQFPYRLHCRQPVFVPPLLSEVKTVLNPKKNPFYEHARMQMFLAVWDKQVVGRIAAIVDDNFINVRQEMVGLFGFFECVDDIDVAHALFNSASQWLRRLELRKMLGPANPSMNDEIGVLLDNFDQPPTVKMVWNPPYYPALYENSVFRKAMDVHAWWANTEDISDRLLKFGEAILKRTKVTFRNVNMKKFDEEVETIRAIYNSAWSQNWGFVPWTAAEFHHAAKGLKQIVDSDFVIIAEVDAKPVAFVLALPDINIALKHINGRLFPFGFIKLLWYSRKIKTARVVILGVIKEYRGRGIDTALYYKSFLTAKEKEYIGGEMSWILENNEPMIKALQMMGARRIKTYRLYERDL